MPKVSKTVARVALAVIHHGLSLPPERLTKREKRRVIDDVQALVEDGHDPHTLLDAARYGMDRVWPYEKGQAWTSKDFRDNVTKAKAEAGRVRRSGQVPTSAREIREGVDGEE